MKKEIKTGDIVKHKLTKKKMMVLSGGLVGLGKNSSPFVSAHPGVFVRDEDMNTFWVQEDELKLTN